MLEGWLFSLETSNKIELDINFFEKKLIHRFLKLEYQIQTKELNLSLNDYYKLIKNKFIGSSFDTSKRILTKKNNYWIRISFFLRGILEGLKND